MAVDEADLTAARAGNADAFMAIVDEYEPRLRGLVHRLLLDPNRLDDVLQEVFLRAFRGLPGWRGSGDVGTWLHRIAYNVSVDELRRRRPVASMHDQGDPRSTAPFEAIDDRSMLVEALAALTPEQRAAIVLVDVEGFDYASAGGVLGVGAGTVSSRVSRARAALRSHLMGQEVR